MLIQSRKVWLANQFIPAIIEFKNDVISGIYPYDSKKVDKDYDDLRVVPGFIDIHTHGAYGYDVNVASSEELVKWAEKLPKDEGVTAFLPTTITQSEEVLNAALKNVVKAKNSEYQGAEMVGIHFEGPYINAENKGAQPEKYILDANVEQFKKYQEVAEGNIKLMTISAEHDKDFSLIKYCKKTGVITSLGHASANYDQIVLAYANGAKSMTHVHNGMPVYHHRNPGMAGAAYRLRTMYGEMICDLNHINPVVVNNYFTLKRDYAIMISDSLGVKGLPKGDYLSGGLPIEVRDNGSAYLKDGGSLAGSSMKMNEGLRNLVEVAEVPFEVALKSCTLNPATMLNLNKGELVVGYDADIVVLKDNYEVEECFCKGK